MNRKLIPIAVALCAGAGLADAALAAEYGTLVSKTAVFAATAVPQQQCVQQEQLVQRPNTGAGSLIGALVGGGVGNAIGGGAGRAAATGLGVIAGAIIGDRAEASANPPVATDVQRCQLVGQVQNRLVGYDVTYDFRGQRYSARVASDPGSAGGVIVLNDDATPIGAAAPSPTAAAPTVLSSAPGVVYAAPAPVVVAAPLVVGPAVPSVGVSIGYGWGGHRWR